MGKSVLVVAAHADDEVLGCGGTLAKHVAAGDDVFAVFLTDGVGSRVENPGGAEIHRRQAANKVGAILGLTEIVQYDFPDNKLDSVPLLKIVQRLESLLDRLQPAVVYTHHAGDLNIDHRIAFQAVLTACRPLPGASVQEIYSFEVLSSTEWAGPDGPVFVPNVFVDIGEQLETKRLALEAYVLEMRPAPHSRSVRHSMLLAEHRGYSVGVAAAEAFQAIRLMR
jgi:LmbE family N-acetylglucosaminyl deacetylase